MIQIEIPMKTPSINHLYARGRFGNTYLKPEAKKIRQEIEDAILPAVGTSFEHVDDKKLKVTVEIHENWYTKDKKIKRVDLANREKFLIDSVFIALGIDDKLIFEHCMRKIQDDKEYAVVTIEELQ